LSFAEDCEAVGRRGVLPECTGEMVVDEGVSDLRTVIGSAEVEIDNTGVASSGGSDEYDDIGSFEGTDTLANETNSIYSIKKREFLFIVLCKTLVCTHSDGLAEGRLSFWVVNIHYNI
jgi:hypothetical protein